MINLVSNHYLDLARHPKILQQTQESLQQWGCGSTGSRLLGGDLEIFHEVETFLAQWKKNEACLLMNTGYAANLGVISAFCTPQTHLFLDRLDHASIIDGARLSGAKIHRFRHNEPEHLKELLQQYQGHRVIAIESVYSMDGDKAPLEDIAALAKEFQAMLIVDEAHAEGVWGPDGKGLVHAFNLQDQVDLVIGTFGKAYGCAGAAVWGKQILIDWLVNHARSFIYSTAMSPAQALSIRASVQVAREEAWRRERVLASSQKVRTHLQQLGLDTLNSETQIIPVVLKTNERALQAMQHMQEQGIWAAAIRAPTVPQGSARLRINLSAGHTDQDIDQILEAFTHIQKV